MPCHCRWGDCRSRCGTFSLDRQQVARHISAQNCNDQGAILQVALWFCQKSCGCLQTNWGCFLHKIEGHLSHKKFQTQSNWAQVDCSSNMDGWMGRRNSIWIRPSMSLLAEVATPPQKFRLAIYPNYHANECSIATSSSLETSTTYLMFATFYMQWYFPLKVMSMDGGWRWQVQVWHPLWMQGLCLWQVRCGRDCVNEICHASAIANLKSMHSSRARHPCGVGTVWNSVSNGKTVATMCYILGRLPWRSRNMIVVVVVVAATTLLTVYVIIRSVLSL